jgi:hypothetical protein
VSIGGSGVGCGGGSPLPVLGGGSGQKAAKRAEEAVFLRNQQVFALRNADSDLRKLFPVHEKWLLVGERWLLVGERWFFMGERWFLVGERWFLVGEKWFLMGERWFLMGEKGFPFDGEGSVLEWKRPVDEGQE